MSKTPLSLGEYPSERRRDIDLLRAIAVLAVIFYHFDVPGVNGGFLGVDIFFVISGYLITLHIRDQMQSGNFSFFYFYLRRIRRLFPALAVILLISSVAAVLILPVNLLKDYSVSLLASSLYLSNVYFWSLADYFDSASIYKPLLHTWSLSVEEQFYIFWPVFIILFFRWSLNVAIIAAGVASLVAAFYFDVSSATVFYHFPFRVFEFALGATMGRMSLDRLSSWTRNGLSFAALLVIALAISFVDMNAPTPNWGTIAATLGTALVIVTSAPILNSNWPAIRPALRVGLISYSAYLAHWPLVVYYKIIFPGTLSLTSAACLLLATFVCAEALYRLVEKPALQLDLLKYRYQIAAILPAILLLSTGFNLTYPALAKIYGSSSLTVASLLASVPDPHDIAPMVEAEISSRKSHQMPDRPKIVVLGDSHGENVATALRLVLGDDNADIRHLASICDPLSRDSITVSMQELYKTHSQDLTRKEGYCDDFHEKFLDNIHNASPDLIVFSEAWRADALPYLVRTIEDIKSIASAKIIVLGRVPQFGGIPSVIYKDLESVDQINKVAWSKRYGIFDEFDVRLRVIAEISNVYFISKRELICPNYICQIQIGDKLGYWDTQHWTPDGMRLYGKRLVSDPLFKSALAQ